MENSQNSGFKYLRRLPRSEEIVKELPLSSKLKEIKQKRDKEIRAVLEGKSDKFLIIVGPCSADNPKAVLEYVQRLSKMQEEVKDKLILIPRVYTNKPRTTGKGYKGLAHQPNPKDKPDIALGIKAMRKLHIDVLEKSGLSAADEMLYPGNHPYLEDLLSYVAIGARSVENQKHRLTASGINVPVGMKNPTSGDFNVMLNAVEAAQAPHIFSYNGFEVETKGNPFSHCILRGAVNKHGRNIPNYHFEDLILTIKKYKERGLKFPAIIVDVSHANADKKYDEQPRIASEVMHSRKTSKEVREMVKGLMIESYIEGGSQSVDEGVYGKSITDPCLGWEDTEKLLRNLADKV